MFMNFVKILIYLNIYLLMILNVNQIICMDPEMQFYEAAKTGDVNRLKELISQKSSDGYRTTASICVAELL